MDTFEAYIDIIGVNPFVLVPMPVLSNIFQQAQKDKGAIQVRGTIDGHPYTQTLVRYSGEWRLYINTPMLKASKKKVGDTAEIGIEFDPVERIIPMHPKLTAALANNAEAKQVFDSLRPSMQKEIVRYISFLKSEEAVDRNVERAMQFLVGKARFIGRDKP